MTGRLISAIAMAALVAVSITAPAVASEGTEGEQESNSVAQGSARATERWAQEFGVYRTVDAVQAYEYASDAGPVVVTYTNDVTPTSDVAEVDEDGRVNVSGSFQTSGRPSLAAFANSGSAWVNVANACQSREQNATGFIDGCYQILQESTDGDASYDYYTFKLWGTAKSTGIFTLSEAYGKSSRSSSSQGAWSWVDWAPRSDTNQGNCVSVTLTVGFAGGSLSAPFTQCDQWDISKGVAAGQFQNYWRGNAYRSEREVAHLTLIKTPTGKWPVWTFDHGFFSF